MGMRTTVIFKIPPTVPEEDRCIPEFARANVRVHARRGLHPLTAVSPFDLLRARHQLVETSFLKWTTIQISIFS